MVKLVYQQSHAGDHHRTNINYKIWLFRIKTGAWKLVNQHVFFWLSCLTELVLFIQTSLHPFTMIKKNPHNISLCTHINNMLTNKCQWVFFTYWWSHLARQKSSVTQKWRVGSPGEDCSPDNHHLKVSLNHREIRSGSFKKVKWSVCLDLLADFFLFKCINTAQKNVWILKCLLLAFIGCVSGKS